MRLRNVATAFLMNGDDILMTERSQTRKIAPGYWYGVGGHLEPDELNDPHAACLREIREETGLDASHVLDLRLRYIVLRRSGQEIVINYFFFGRTDTRKVAQAAGEDVLHWIPRREALDRPFFPAIGLTLAHGLEAGAANGAAGDDRLQMGLVALANDEPAIRWRDIVDWADQV